MGDRRGDGDTGAMGCAQHLGLGGTIEADGDGRGGVLAQDPGVASGVVAAGDGDVEAPVVLDRAAGETVGGVDRHARGADPGGKIGRQALTRAGIVEIGCHASLSPLVAPSSRVIRSPAIGRRR